MTIRLKKGYLLMEKMFIDTKVALSEQSMEELGGVFRVVDSNGCVIRDDEYIHDGDYVLIGKAMFNYSTAFDDKITGDIYYVFPDNAVIGVYTDKQKKEIDKTFTLRTSDVINRMKKVNPPPRQNIIIDPKMPRA